MDNGEISHDTQLKIMKILEKLELIDMLL